MREEWRDLLSPYDVTIQTIYLATDRATCLSRLRSRGMAHGDDFAITAELAAAYFDSFEPPTQSEGPLVIIDGD